MDPTENDKRFMQRCIELAKVAFDQGNTPVGSLIECGGTIIAEGVETLPAGNDISGHAELLAVRQASNQLGTQTLRDSTLYTTAEPCFMCSYAIRNAEISRVVYCLDTPMIGGATSIHPILIDRAMNNWKPAPEVVAGVLESEFVEAKAGWQATKG